MPSLRALVPVLLLPACYVEVHTDKDSGDTGFQLEDSPPGCRIVFPADGQIIPASQLVTLEAEVGDAETPLPALEVTWESNVAEDLGISTPDEYGVATLVTDLLGPGLHLITLTVTDQAGNPCVDQVTVDAQSAPVVSLTAPTQGSVIDQGTITFAATVSDAEEAPNLLSLAWTDDLVGVIDTTPADALGAAGFSTDALTLGLHTVTLTATDASGLVGSASVTFTVNGVPTSPTVSILPADPDTNADLVVNLDVPSVDPDGSPVSYLYEWLRDGVPDAASTTDTLPASATNRGETWTVNVTPTDGVTNGPVGTAAVVIANSAPAITLTVTPDPEEVVTDTVISATASALDGDPGDEVVLEYRWQVNGLVLAESGPVLDGEIWFDKGDLVELTVTADDGATPAEAYWSTTVGNTPPYAGLIAVEPASPSDADDLVCGILIASVDPDGDPVDYRFAWDVNGIPVGGASTTTFPGDTIEASATLPGEFWTCTVTPNDGEDDGVTRQDSVIVQ